MNFHQFIFYIVNIIDDFHRFIEDCRISLVLDDPLQA